VETKLDANTKVSLYRSKEDKYYEDPKMKPKTNYFLYIGISKLFRYTKFIQLELTPEVSSTIMSSNGFNKLTTPAKITLKLDPKMKL